MNRKDEAGNEIKIKVIAGEVDGVKALAPPPDSWAARAEAKVTMLLIDLAPGASWTLSAEEAGLNRRLYFYDGNSMQADGHTLAAGHRDTLKFRRGFQCYKEYRRKAGSFSVAAGETNWRARWRSMVPFVMNTRNELEQAFSDYQKDQFGGWPWADQDQVHGRQRALRDS